MPNASLVVTSVSAPNAVLRAFARGARRHGLRFILIGDTKSPDGFQLEGCEFHPVGGQHQLPFPLARALPTGHYSRKNIGYLLARHDDVLVESDDDNLPGDGFWEIPGLETEGDRVGGKPWVNVYRYFSGSGIWPRGFPLEHVHRRSRASLRRGRFATPIHQRLVDDDPDVDAVYRMTRRLPVRFRRRRPVVLGSGSWCPFNSQNTVWHREAFPLLYLPSHCSFRVADIWRSLVAQRIAWTNGWRVAFHGPTASQRRNPHDLLRDFREEIPGYLHNDTLRARLSRLELAPGVRHLTANLAACYQDLVDGGFLDPAEMDLLRLWIREFDGPSL